MGRLKEFDADKAIDRAIDCFWARGYEATSVRDLAEHMGIGGASLYNAYGGKRALFATALERYADSTSRQRIARLEETGRPKEAIRTFFAELIDRSLADPQRRGCLFVNSALDVAPHDAELGKAVAGYLEEVRAFFQRCIVAHINIREPFISWQEFMKCLARLLSRSGCSKNLTTFRKHTRSHMAKHSSCTQN